jgi:hypothetical protein
MNRPKCRQVLDCASLLAFWIGRRVQERQRTAALHDAGARKPPLLGYQCASQVGHGMIISDAVERVLADLTI